jgi:hypothetical protein
VEGALKGGLQIHLAFCRVFDELGVDNNLVWLTEAKVDSILLYQLAILL